MATRCGNPSGPSVAMVTVRLCWRKDATSSSVIRISARWLPAMSGSFLRGAVLVDQPDGVIDAAVDILDRGPIHHPGTQRPVEHGVDHAEHSLAIGVERPSERGLHAGTELLRELPVQVGRIGIRG